jgi:hypothetical protein
MKKKPTPDDQNQGPHKAVVNWRKVPEQDLWRYARSFHTAAKTLAGTLELDSGPLSEFDVAPVVFMYRHAVELHLKAMVLGDGGNFLATRPDSISVSKSHSVSWLAQFVCQIVTALKWEKEFRCQGIATLADFKAVVEEVNSVDPGSYVFRCPVDPQSESSVVEFTKKMDAVIGLLESTGDALAAEWDLRSEAPPEVNGNGSGFEPVI